MEVHYLTACCNTIKMFSKISKFSLGSTFKNSRTDMCYDFHIDEIELVNDFINVIEINYIQIRRLFHKLDIYCTNTH